ncbi:response regulator transcription factor [Litorilinea aerophila]|uniref:Response regulator transcription factor n=1 Tax=Litorilinea aerophila TaxID=1204385 RepID=A0A540VLG0_9CHLR|nr:response regulator transcription factor [Litorilinea aerophila]MCC9074832.1 response regulator transcription factor [Litorilinea aerophila]OUC06815.1 hypothetical protein RY27_18710 [Litorilinea aerophila]
MGNRILVIDDDSVLSELVVYMLRGGGYEVVAAGDGEEGLRKFQAEPFDLVILDINMPGMDGFEVCRRIRSQSQVPIIMLTAQGSDEAVVRGLDLGADDYVTKPFRLKPLMARVRANLRRAQAPDPTFGRVRYHDDYLSIDLESQRIAIQGRAVKLTPMEYQLLATLVKNRGQVLEARKLLEQVWGQEYAEDLDYLRLYIWHLRRKIEPDPDHPRYIQDVGPLGYSFSPADAP